MEELTKVQKLLFGQRDEAYAAFQAKLTPGIALERFIGVRLPVLRRIEKDLEKAGELKAFAAGLPHGYYDEDLLHAIYLSRLKPYGECLFGVEAFLPYVNNWAVCDTLRPKVFEKHTEELLPHIRRWAASSHTYTCRFAIDMLMTYYLDAHFETSLMDIPAGIVRDDYYVNMMIAWYFATALAKQWDAAVSVLQQQKLPLWVHNKTIQKAIESFRITDERKAYLRSLRR